MITGTAAADNEPGNPHAHAGVKAGADSPQRQWIGDYDECFGEALQNGVLELSLRLVAGPGEKGWPNKLAFCRRHGLPGHLPGDP